MEINLTDTNAKDEISIRTRHGKYTFRVTDPTRCLGLLSGGELGNQKYEALFSGTVLPTSFSTSSRVRFQIGTRAVFHVRIKGGLKLVTTAPITQLAFVTDVDRERVKQSRFGIETARRFELVTV